MVYLEALFPLCSFLTQYPQTMMSGFPCVFIETRFITAAGTIFLPFLLFCCSWLMHQGALQCSEFIHKNLWVLVLLSACTAPALQAETGESAVSNCFGRQWRREERQKIEMCVFLCWRRTGGKYMSVYLHGRERRYVCWSHAWKNPCN